MNRDAFYQKEEMGWRMLSLAFALTLGGNGKTPPCGVQTYPGQ